MHLIPAETRLPGPRSDKLRSRRPTDPPAGSLWAAVRHGELLCRPRSTTRRPFVLRPERVDLALQRIEISQDVVRSRMGTVC